MLALPSMLLLMKVDDSSCSEKPDVEKPWKGDSTSPAGGMAPACIKSSKRKHDDNGNGSDDDEVVRNTRKQRGRAHDSNKTSSGLEEIEQEKVTISLE
jgi:hypothetical protein